MTMRDGQAVPTVPNELGVPSADNTNVVESAPVDTSASEEAPEAEETPAEEPQTEEAPQSDAVETETPSTEEAPAEEEELSLPTLEHIKAMQEAQSYVANTDVKADILDEFGNVDPEKFQAFMEQNNRTVYDKAIQAVEARSGAQAAEDAAWDKVHEAYPEIKEYNLDAALRGARIQDITAGGDGDLARLARDLAGPFRQAKIKATEDINKVVEEAESLETLKPTEVTPPKEPLPLMAQLKAAVAEGDTETAQRLRHEIRKQRIAQG